MGKWIEIVLGLLFLLFFLFNLWNLKNWTLQILDDFFLNPIRDLAKVRLDHVSVLEQFGQTAKVLNLTYLDFVNSL